MGCIFERIIKRSILLLIFLFMVCVAQAGEYKTYEQISTAKAGQAFDEDINVWVYTSEFAKRFAMPAQWIDDSLKGAHAVAFRVETASSKLFFPHKGPDVSMLIRRCILDIYMDRNAPIPWVDDNEMGFHYYTPDSMTYLAPQSKHDVEHRRRPVGLPEYGMPAIMRSSEQHGTIRLAMYDRNVYPGIAYLSFNIGCMTPPKENTSLEFRRGGDSTDTKIVHLVEIPKKYMQRLYDNWYERSRKPATGEWSSTITAPNRNGSR